MLRDKSMSRQRVGAKSCEIFRARLSAVGKIDLVMIATRANPFSAANAAIAAITGPSCRTAQRATPDTAAFLQFLIARWRWLHLALRFELRYGFA
jgi:hypothetical protein